MVFVIDSKGAVCRNAYDIIIPDTISERICTFMNILVFRMPACKMAIVRGINTDREDTIDEITIPK